MLPKFSEAITAGANISLRLSVNHEIYAHVGALPHGARLLIELTVPRRYGVSGALLRLWNDQYETEDRAREIPLPRTDLDPTADTYALEVDTAALCGDETSGLFYYSFCLERGGDPLCSDTPDNLTAEWGRERGMPFRLLVYEKDFTTPDWFPGGVMYHIFVDRFRRGKGAVTLREGSELDPDWENGVPMYGEKPGDPVKNNVFFGGNLWGILEKLDYLKDLGVSVLYLSPVFEAYSNHKYDTGDYETVDGLFGGEEAFAALLEGAHARGMRVILDGVFNHTGDDSRYFNRYGRYPSVGAANAPDSPYASWYSFTNWPDEYECWWGVKILPRLNGASVSCRDYLTGIAASRVAQGVDGWRLDVADELSDEFLDELRAATHEAAAGRGGDAPLILGEVWENAADKMAYGRRRRYLRGRQLDSVMNYPFRQGVLSYLLDRDCGLLCDVLTEIYVSYPAPVCHCLMNLLGTHDTERILTLLGDDGEGFGLTNAEMASARLSDWGRARAKRLLMMATTIQFTVYGVPSVYYGDEAGSEGYRDPFCRRPYPWGREDAELVAHYRNLGSMRRGNPVFRDGDFGILEKEGPWLVFARGDLSFETPGGTVIVLCNRGDDTRTWTPPEGKTGKWSDLLMGDEGTGPIPVAPDTARVILL